MAMRFGMLGAAMLVIDSVTMVLLDRLALG